MKQPMTVEEGWKIMQENGIHKLKIFLEGTDPKVASIFTSAEYMELYTIVYDLCIHKSTATDAPEQLYGRYRATLEDYISSTVMPSLRDKDDEFLLKELVLRWSNHKIMFQWLTRFCNYLDRYYVERKNLPKLNKVGTICFRDPVYNELESKFTGAVTALIDRERDGEKIDRSLLKNVVDFYVGIGAAVEADSTEYYVNDLEKAAVIKATAAYYSRKASTWIVHDSCPEYMIKAEDCLKREKERVFNYLHSSSETILLETVQHELLTVVSSQLLEKENSGCKALLRDDKVEDLSRMYRLFSKIPHGVDPVALAFKNHVTEEGMALVKQEEDAASSKKAEKKGVVGSNEQSFITNLIDLHEKYLKYVETCFSSHVLFHKSLKEAFEVFCNKEIAGNSSAELLSTFLDNVLKKAGDESIEETLENVVRLLAYISDKDLFAEFYRKKLARRLVTADKKKSNDDENDRSILSKFKQAYGGQFTSKMEGMLNDMMLAEENGKLFTTHLVENPKLKPAGMDSLSVTVLTTGFWPTYKSSDLNLPSELVKCVEVFRDFYETKTKHRKLTWLFSLGNCTVKGFFEAKTIELFVTTYQASVLMLFNACGKLSFEEILTQLNLPEDDVVRLLHSLSCAKYKILNKLPETKTISNNDVFEFNGKFTDKLRRVKVPLPPLDDKKKVVEDVEQDRRYAVDAAVVRIMKSRKVLGYQILVMECMEMIGRMFKPDVKLIKKRIEHLISSDYLERDKENPNLFKYLA